jgi:IPT/TIG domain-containing protein
MRRPPIIAAASAIVSIFAGVVVAGAIFAAAGGCNEKKGLSVSPDIKPNRGPYLGGDPVTISGTGFSPTQSVQIYFGSRAAKAPVVKEGEIVVEPPAGEVGKTVDVVLVFPDSKSITIKNAYTYIDPTDLEKKPNPPPGTK